MTPEEHCKLHNLYPDMICLDFELPVTYTPTLIERLIYCCGDFTFTPIFSHLDAFNLLMPAPEPPPSSSKAAAAD